MRHGATVLGALAKISMTVASLAACSSIFGSDDRWCPRGDPAPFGCARLVAVVDGPGEPWPALRKFGIWVAPARALELGSIELAMTTDSAGVIPLVVVDHAFPVAELPDTLSMWIVAKLFQVPSPPVVGEPLPVFAVDSVLHVVDFTVQRVDTVRLRLRRP